MTMEGRSVCCFVFLVSLMTFVVSAIRFERQVTTECLCPCKTECQLPANGSYTNLYYSQAKGTTDTVHYVTSTIGYPGILIARTPPHVNIEINLKNLISGDLDNSITFTNTEYYVYALHFVRLLEYNDVDDKANVSAVPADAALWKVFDLATDVPWTNASIHTNLTANQITLTITNTSQKDNYTDSHSNNRSGFLFQGNGSISITIHLNSVSGRSEEMPHLLYTANSSLVEVTVDHLQPTFSNSRFAVEMVLVTSDVANKSQASLETSRSIDDEHTPGVFTVKDITTGGRDQQSTSAFLQFKPVCYKSQDRAVKTATKAKSYPLEDSQRAGLRLAGRRSLARAYFGHTLPLQMAVGMNVSFGLTKDKFYTDTNYTTWLFSVGYGVPPVEEVSSVVLVIISVGFGIPVLLILFGGVGVCVHRNKRRETSAYTAIN